MYKTVAKFIISTIIGFLLVRNGAQTIQDETYLSTVQYEGYILNHSGLQCNGLGKLLCNVLPKLMIYNHFVVNIVTCKCSNCGDELEIGQSYLAIFD